MTAVRAFAMQMPELRSLFFVNPIHLNGNQKTITSTEEIKEIKQVRPP